MNDIADMMSVSRQTIYRMFESRSELLEYIATERVDLLAQKLTKFVAQFDTLGEAIVDGMAYSVKLGRADELLVEILRQEGDAHFKTFMFGGTEEVQTLMMNAWGPLIRKARENGELDAGISDVQAIEWICNIGAVLNIREDYDEEDHRRILRQFVIPSLSS